MFLAQTTEQIANPWFFLKEVNASLNAVALILLILGWIAIKRGKEGLHRACMLSAAGVSALFLTSYLSYHAQVGSVSYGGQGTMRVLYFIILISHVSLAALQVPLILMVIRRGLKGQRERHRRLARITLPIWLYVSATGVIVYLMLYGWPG